MDVRETEAEYMDAVASTLEEVEKSSGERMLKYFRFRQLPFELKRHSMPFAKLAIGVVQSVTSSPERTAGLRKLLEAKDCIVRAALD